MTEFVPEIIRVTSVRSTSRIVVEIRSSTRVKAWPFAVRGLSCWTLNLGEIVTM